MSVRRTNGWSISWSLSYSIGNQFLDASSLVCPFVRRSVMLSYKFEIVAYEAFVVYSTMRENNLVSVGARSECDFVCLSTLRIVVPPGYLFFSSANYIFEINWLHVHIALKPKWSFNTAYLTCTAATTIINNKNTSLFQLEPVNDIQTSLSRLTMRLNEWMNELI